jgi:hypothetical protein
MGVSKSRSLWGPVAVTGASLATLVLSVSCTGPNQVAPAAVSAPVSAGSTTETQFEDWRFVVRTEVDSGATTAPACDSVGFTGESNNLYLTKTLGKWPKMQYPSIVFAETNDTSRKQASCTTEGSKG